MRTIERLPEAVHSSVRSEVVICDLTRIVEELVFNSLDAGATKVYVAVGVDSSYVKVLDNGSGITRDELVLMGERYATSKVNHLALMDNGNESLEFHGEALCSISNVSLLEIVSKARGKPNGYRKIMKNSKCLFFGINDDRQDVGTTVIVRDIFYNQPVRRKHMKSSPKKVLDSIKLSLLRIALVHVNVSFKFMDVEGADELLHTGPSPSPLPILSTHFGIDNSATFYELNLYDGKLKLSGHISDPREILSLKAIQYIYINSRFIGKGPIHKLLNQLAAKFDFLRPSQHATSSQKEKRNIYDMCPTFILNIHCPRSYYDIVTSDRSRISVEFKDWGPVLALIENGVMRIWTNNISHDMPDTLGGSKKRCRKENSKTPLDLHSPQRKKLCKNYDNMPALEACVSSIQKHQIEEGLPSGTDYLSQSRDAYLSSYNVTAEEEIINHLSPCSVSSPLHAAYPYSQKEDGRSSSALRIILPAEEEIINHLSPCSVFSPVHVTYPCSQKEDFRSFSALRAILPADEEIINHRSPCSAYPYSQKEDGRSSSALRILPAYNDKIDDISGIAGVSNDWLNFSNDIHFDLDPSKPFLRSCSFEMGSLHGRKSPANDENFEFGCHDIRNRKCWITCDGSMVDEIDMTICGRDLQCDGAPPFQSSPVAQYDKHEISELSIMDMAKPCLMLNSNLPHSSKRFGERNTNCQSFRSGWFHKTADEIIGIKSLDDGDDGAICTNLVDGCSEFGTVNGYSTQGETEDFQSFNLNIKESILWENPSIMSFSPHNKRRIGEFHGRCFENMFSPKPSKIFNARDWSHLRLYGEDCPNNCSEPSLYDTSLAEHERERPDRRIHGKMLNRKSSSMRSHSAPPSFKGKKRFLDLTDSSTMLSAKRNSQNTCLAVSSTEPASSCHGGRNVPTIDMKCSQKSFGEYHPSSMDRSVMDSSFAKRPGSEMTPEVVAFQNVTPKRRGQFVDMATQCLNMKAIDDSFDSRWKWRNCSLPTTDKSRSDNKKNLDVILDISSDALQLDFDSLVPKSIDRTSFEGAKVLNQVDKKFIAVVAGNTLAVVDQHAADERIRLEEFRHKVLSGEMKRITYLDPEQELVLPEIGYQLLQSYAEKIQNWGWICNIHSQDMSSFAKNLDFLHRQPTVVKLLAVPCILGFNLSDIDLLEFLQQLADTDGSSVIPPSVHRVLNNKACRGAIMFGDTLLFSECSLLVEELKRTSLLFQCAHGRPTTVPLVNLDLLHNKIVKLGSDEHWHGLRKHRFSLERSSLRLKSASC